MLHIKLLLSLCKNIVSVHPSVLATTVVPPVKKTKSKKKSIYTEQGSEMAVAQVYVPLLCL